MNQLSERSKQDLLSDLAWQYPLHPAEFSACPACRSEMGGRGGWFCRDCIRNELIKRGVSETGLSDLIQRLVRAQTLHQEISDSIRKLGRCDENVRRAVSSSC